MPVPGPDPALIDRFRRDLGLLVGEPKGSFALAVSGGSDSLALLLLSASALPDQVAAATVDHGLRPESAGEAALVRRICGELGVPHRTLTVTVEREGHGVQAAARKARYAALGGWMMAENMTTLLTAHHADDQAETLLMRLNRGSGMGGLAGVRATGPLPGGDAQRLCRPLLSWRRETLAGIVRSSGLEPVEDPSNVDPAYDRARYRAALRHADWLDPAALARSAAWLGEGEEAIAWAAARLAGERLQESGGGITLRSTDLPSELARRLVLICLTRLEPEAAPRGEALAAFVAMLRGGGVATLGGVKGVGEGETWRFERAPPRRP
jgi:tRNA(Ile)-lysidine synthase